MALIRIATGVKDQIDSSASTPRSSDEFVIRKAVEDWGRPLWPDARLVHELVVGRGQCRADMAFIQPAHLIGIEIKSGWDNSSRLMMQSAYFSLACREIWIVIDAKHGDDTEMVHYLMPWLGVIHADVKFPEKYEERKDLTRWTCALKTVHEPKPHAPMPKCWLEICWRDELYAEAQRHNLQPPAKIRHGDLIDLLLEKLSDEERSVAVCRQLRARDAFWRSDERIIA